MSRKVLVPLEVLPGTAPTHAVNKAQLDGGMDDRVAVSGDVMTGPLGMGTQQIYNLATGTSNDHAVNKGQMDTAIAAAGGGGGFTGTVGDTTDWDTIVVPGTYNTINIGGTNASVYHAPPEAKSLMGVLTVAMGAATDSAVDPVSQVWVSSNTAWARGKNQGNWSAWAQNIPPPYDIDLVLRSELDAQGNFISWWRAPDTGGGSGASTGYKLTELTALTGAGAATTDIFEVVDVSDTTMAASGTNKKMTFAEMIAYLQNNLGYLWLEQPSGNTIEVDPISANPAIVITRSSGGIIELNANAAPVVNIIGSGQPQYRVNNVDILLGVVKDNRSILTTAPLSGGGDLTSNLTLQLNAAGVANSHLAQMPAKTIKANDQGGASSPTDLTVAQAQTLLAIPGLPVTVANGGTGRITATSAYGLITAGTTATGVQQTVTPAASGFLKTTSATALPAWAAIASTDVSGLGSLATKSTIASADITDGVVSNTDLTTMATQTIKGNNTASTAAPLDLTAAQARSMLASGGGALFGFDFDTTTTAGPAVTRLRLNNATPASATIVYITYTSKDGVDLKTRLAAGTAGDRLYIQDRANSANWRMYELTGVPTDGTTYASCPVVHRSGAGSLWANATEIIAGFMSAAITIGTSAPASPLTNDIWIDTT